MRITQASIDAHAPLPRSGNLHVCPISTTSTWYEIDVQIVAGGDGPRDPRSYLRPVDCRAVPAGEFKGKMDTVIGDRPAPTERSLVALGYAGWGAGQLEAELADNTWLTAPATAELLFEAPIEDRARLAAARIGVDLSKLSTCAGRA